MPVTGSPISSDPTSPVVAMADAKNYLRIDGADQDSVISGLITFATDWVQRETNQTLLTTGRVLYLDKFPATFGGISAITGTLISRIDQRQILLPIAPVQSVDSVQYLFNGQWQTLATSIYTADAYNVADGVVRAGRVVLNANASQTWPQTDDVANAVKISYTVGYGNASQVPQLFKQAILWLVSHAYENREIILQGTKKPLEVPWSLRALLESLMFREAHSA